MVIQDILNLLIDFQSVANSRAIYIFGLGLQLVTQSANPMVPLSVSNWLPGITGSELSVNQITVPIVPLHLNT